MAEKKLRDQMRDVARLRHLSLRTEEAYWNWIKRYISFHNKRHPAEMGEDEIRSFISDLASKKSVAASTQTVALSAPRAYPSHAILLAGSVPCSLTCPIGSTVPLWRLTGSISSGGLGAGLTQLATGCSVFVPTSFDTLGFEPPSVDIPRRRESQPESRTGPVRRTGVPPPRSGKSRG